MAAAEDSLEDKICVVIGATSGIGQVTAHALSEMGAELFWYAVTRTRANAWQPTSWRAPTMIA